MMLKFKTISLITSLATAIFFTACSKDDEIISNSNKVDRKEQVYNGEVVHLGLSASVDGFTDHDGRAIEFNTDNPIGRPLVYLTPPEDEYTPPRKIKVLCVFRKLGDPNSTTYTELDWIVKEDGRSIYYKGDVQLASGKFLKSDNGKWYMMAIIGGTVTGLDTGDVKVSFNGQRTYLEDFLHDKRLNLDVPYIQTWVPLEIGENTKANKEGLRFKPQGAIARIEVRNNMIYNYRERAILGNSNAFSQKGYFDISKTSISDNSLTTSQATAPKWYITSKESEFPTPDNRFQTDGRGIHSSDYLLEGSEKSTVKQDPGTSYFYNFINPTVDYDPPRDTFHNHNYHYNNADIKSGYQGPKPYYDRPPYDIANSTYTWFMPTDIPKEKAKTDFYIRTVHTEALDISTENIIPSFSTNIKFENGRYYRIYPEITSDLVIAQVAVHYYTDSNHYGYPDEGPDELHTRDLGHRYYSIITLLNPTLDPINLLDYGVIRTTLADGAKPSTDPAPRFFAYGIGAVEDPMKATVLPLKVLASQSSLSNAFNGSFASWQGPRGAYDIVPNRPNRYRLRLGDPPIINSDGKLLLMPGKTVVLGNGSYVYDGPKSQFEPKSMIDYELFAPKPLSDRTAQWALAISDSKTVTNRYPDQYGKHGGVLDIGGSQGFLLVKATNSGFKLIDSEVPYAPTYTDQSMFTSHWADFKHFHTKSNSDEYNRLDEDYHGHINDQGEIIRYPALFRGRFVADFPRVRPIMITPTGKMPFAHWNYTYPAPQMYGQGMWGYNSLGSIPQHYGRPDKLINKRQWTRKSSPN